MAIAPDRPETVTGVEWLVVELLPSWPYALEPQQRAVPTHDDRQVCAPPAEIAVAPARPETVPGVVRFDVEPVPSRPEPPAPQQRTVPPATSAQVWLVPASTWSARTPTLKPVTSVGVASGLAAADPSCLLPLFPQHLTLPFESRAQLCWNPTLTWTAPARPTTTSGLVSVRLVPPMPTWPWSLAPQQRPVPSHQAAQRWTPWLLEGAIVATLSSPGTSVAHD
jgi:hypothetical protein